MRDSSSRRLPDFALFQGIGSRAVEQLAARAPRRAIERGKILYLPGEPPDFVFFLASGRVKISRLSDHGKELILDIVEPGSLFGEASVLDEKPRASVAEVLEAGAVHAVPAPTFLRVLESEPELLMRVAKLIGERRRELEKRLMDVVYKNAPQRLADLLLQLSQSYGVRDSRGILLRIKLSQSALGNLLGVSREIVNHTFSGLRRRGVIRVEEGRVIIQDPDALAELAA